MKCLKHTFGLLNLINKLILFRTILDYMGTHITRITLQVAPCIMVLYCFMELKTLNAE